MIKPFGRPGPGNPWGPSAQFAAAAPAAQPLASAAAAPQRTHAARQANPLAPVAGRMYANARHTATSAGFGGSDTSADTELRTSLQTLRSRSRQMMRDAAYAKRARNLVVNNVIGQGIGLQAMVGNSRGGMHNAANADIEAEFAEWGAADSCHTGGALAFGDLERMAMGQVFEAGEVFIRMHMRPFGRSRVPLALELIEAERIADQIADPAAVGLRGELRMGVEVDQFQRPLRYMIRRRHPGDLYQHDLAAMDVVEAVPASEIFHLRIIDRWPQTRSEPWLHTALRKLDDLNEVIGLEVQAARGMAAFFATVETDDDAPLGNDGDDDDDPVVNIDPLSVQHLDPGKKLVFHQPTRPNLNLDPFTRFMLREIAAAAGPSYESVSRDYSQTNYSSGRLGQLDDRDLWRVLQQWWVRSFRQPLHRLWTQQAVLSRAVTSISLREYMGDARKFEAARFKCRGWTWVDPTKEVKAYKEAVLAGFTTVTDVIAQTAGGQDFDDVLTTRAQELVRLREAGVEVDTTVRQAATGAATTQPPAQASAQDAADDDAQPTDDTTPQGARVLRMRPS